MSLASLGKVLKVFGGGDIEPSESPQFVREVLLLTLAGASSADTHVVSIEVSTVRRALREATGEDVSEAEIRVAAGRDLFAGASVDSTVAKLKNKLSHDDRRFLIRKLGDVIRSDARVSQFELDYFDRIANALNLRPWEIAGFQPSD